LTPRILVLGAGGMLGHKMFQRLRRDFPETYGTLHGPVDVPPFDAVSLFHDGRVFDRVDVLHAERLQDLLGRLQPAVIVNCVGVIKQRPDAKSPVPSIRINALLPHELTEICRQWGGRVIHFSTDCVFSGRRGGYSEADVADADDLYGRTKFLGEVSTENALTLRTSIIGRELTHHQSLLDWFLGQNHRSVPGFTRAIYSGVTTNHLSDVVARLIASGASLHGVYQVASEPISKHDLLVLIKQAYGLDIDIVPDDRVVCDRSLSGGKFDTATGHRCPAWPDLVATLAADPTPYSDWLHYETV
jgi:dTDP-4-dehydrorhamnose reductase